MPGFVVMIASTWIMVVLLLFKSKRVARKLARTAARRQPGEDCGMSYETPYAGLKVVDLSQGVAGPYCAMLLAQYGANVIKVEPTENGDWSRGLGVRYGDNTAYSIPCQSRKTFHRAGPEAGRRACGAVAADRRLPTCSCKASAPA